MVNFSKNENDIKKYIEENFTKYLLENKMLAPSEWVDDVLDFDAHIKNITVFYDFDAIDFTTQTFETNNQQITLELCFVCRNKKGEELRQLSRDYATAFYNWFYLNRSLGGLIDYGSIDTVNFFDAVSGTKAIKISNLTLTLNLDD